MPKTYFWIPRDTVDSRTPAQDAAQMAPLKRGMPDIRQIGL
jgi:hypothetical protein